MQYNLDGKVVIDVQQAINSTQVGLMEIDSSSQSSVGKFTHVFLERNRRLDILTHNAVGFCHAQKRLVLTADGIETIFATTRTEVKANQETCNAEAQKWLREISAQLTGVQPI